MGETHQLRNFSLALPSYSKQQKPVEPPAATEREGRQKKGIDGEDSLILLLEATDIKS